MGFFSWFKKLNLSREEMCCENDPLPDVTMLDDIDDIVDASHIIRYEIPKKLPKKYKRGRRPSKLSSHVADFIKERCFFASNSEIDIRKLYYQYLSWIKGRNINDKKLCIVSFGSALNYYSEKEGVFLSRKKIERKRKKMTIVIGIGAKVPVFAEEEKFLT